MAWLHSVAAGSISRYDFSFVPSAVVITGSEAALVTFTLSQFSGDATLLTKVHTDGAMGGKVPVPGNAHYTARVVGGTASITINKADPIFNSLCGGPNSFVPCTVHVAVVGNAASTFSIGARTDTGVQLSDGIPVTTQVAQGSMTYFHYTHTQPLSSVVFAVTSISGPVDLFVSNTNQASNVPPTAAASTWRVTTLSPNLQSQAATVTINPTDANACAAPCVYYIGVAAAAASDGVVSFSVLGRTRDLTSVELPDAQPLVDAATASKYNYYAFTFPASATTLRLSVLPVTGRLQFFANVNGVSPLFGTAQYSTSGPVVAGTEGALTISRPRRQRRCHLL
jgi:hypothetical protein